MQPWVVPIYFLKSNRRFLKWNDTLYDYNPVFGRVIYCLTIYGAFVFYLRPNYYKSTNYIEQNFSHLKKSEVSRLVAIWSCNYICLPLYKGDYYPGRKLPGVFHPSTVITGFEKSPYILHTPGTIILLFNSWHQ